MKVHRLNKAGTHLVIDDGKEETFVSYETVIARRYLGRVMLDREKWDYSHTTGRYRNMFLGESKRETQKKINSGEYTLEDLNS